MSATDLALRPRPSVVLTEMRDGTGVLLDLDTKFYFSLNRSGLVAWHALVAAGSAGAGTAALVDALCERFEVGAEQARGDVEALLGELRQEGLVEPVGGEGG